MRKTLLLIFSLFILMGCNNNNSSKNKENNSTLSDSIKNIELAIAADGSDDSDMYGVDMKAIEAKNESSAKKLKHLFASNGGLIGFFEDGGVVGCPRCDLLMSNVMALYEDEPYTTYRQNLSSLVFDNGNNMDIAENGEIIDGWVIINHQPIHFKQSISDFFYYNADTLYNQNNTLPIKETCLLELDYTSDAGENVDNEAADDLAYYLSESRIRFKDMGVSSTVVKKKYLKLDVGNKQIIVDTEKLQNGMYVNVLLYKKGKLPIIVDITDSEMEIPKQYLEYSE